jgi:hypothetical protein
MRRIALAIALALTCGCVTPATEFRGSPLVPDGPKGCKAVCEGWGMELAGMVQMGQYSNGCICQVKGQPSAAVGAAGPAVTGVQQRKAEEEKKEEKVVP